jgi:16S rRNA (guanine527-N7)-methyltransferase
MELIRKYFPCLDRGQYRQFERLLDVVPSLNRKVNIVSRKDMPHLEVHHVLHSLAIAKRFEFGSDASVIDAGTGGGFPGIPLAILFPSARFTLVDSIGKKIRMVREICRELDLKNTRVIQARIENLEISAEYVVSRAVASFPTLVRWTQHLIRTPGENAGGFNQNAGGLIALKGGELDEELGPYMHLVELYPISVWFSESFFSTKTIVYLKK